MLRSYVTRTRGNLGERNCAAAGCKKYVAVVSCLGDRGLLKEISVIANKFCSSTQTSLRLNMSKLSTTVNLKTARQKFIALTHSWNVDQFYCEIGEKLLEDIKR